MTHNTNSSIKPIVMRRVRIVYALQPLFTTTTLSIAIFIFVLAGIGREVQIAHVLRNMPSLTNINAVGHFYLSAFLDTRSIVQVLTLLTLAAFIWLSYNLFHTIRAATRFA